LINKFSLKINASKFILLILQVGIYLIKLPHGQATSSSTKIIYLLMERIYFPKFLFKL